LSVANKNTKTEMNYRSVLGFLIFLFLESPTSGSVAHSLADTSDSFR